MRSRVTPKDRNEDLTDTSEICVIHWHVIYTHILTWQISDSSRNF